MLVGCWSIEPTDELILRIPTQEVERDLVTAEATTHLVCNEKYLEVPGIWSLINCHQTNHLLFIYTLY